MTGLELAFKCHAGQYRKGERNGVRIPYIVHPIEVAKQLFDWGVATPAMMDAAYCHDVLEDTNVSWKGLKQVIGDDAYDIVRELTHDAQQCSKEYYISQIAKKRPETIVIKVADRICNVKDFLITDPEYAGKYLDKGDAIFQAFYAKAHPIRAMFGNKCYHRIYYDIMGVQSRCYVLADQS